MQKLLAWRKKAYDLIRDDDDNKLAGTIFDSIVIGFIALNVVFIILDTFHFSGWYPAVSNVVEFISVLVFTAEYILRIWTAPLIWPEKRPAAARVKYIFSFMALIDLLSILPTYLPFLFPINLSVLRSLRIIRLLRVFKIGRYTDTLEIISYVFKKKAHQLISSMFIVFLLMLIASVIMYEVESTAQPEKFDNAFSAFWWAVSTVTTVGYGDLYPITPAGKVLGGVIALLGIGLVAVPTGIISAGFIEAIGVSEKHEQKRRGRKRKAPAVAAAPPKEAPAVCPHCGQPLGHE
ncbi:MAG: ion transporter [Oscillospiraceae bacterium]